MAKVNHYSVEVKYYGDIEDYTLDDLKEKAYNRIYHGYDPFDSSEELPEEEARKIDGVYKIDNRYPCNKLAYVVWAEIEETEEE